MTSPSDIERAVSAQIEMHCGHCGETWQVRSGYGLDHHCRGVSEARIREIVREEIAAALARTETKT